MSAYASDFEIGLPLRIHVSEFSYHDRKIFGGLVKALLIFMRIFLQSSQNEIHFTSFSSLFENLSL